MLRLSSRLSSQLGWIQFKRRSQRISIAAGMVAELMETVGISHLVAVDLHATQIEGSFHIPLDGLTAVPRLSGALATTLPSGFGVSLVLAPLLAATIHCLSTANPPRLISASVGLGHLKRRPSRLGATQTSPLRWRTRR
jgi:hypothetical protein